MKSIVHLLSLIVLLAASQAFAGCGDKDPDDAPGSDSTQGAKSDSLGEGPIGTVVEDAAGSRYTLKLSPKTGDVYTYQLVRQQRMSTEGFKSSLRETHDFTLRVVSVNDDRSMVLGVKYNRVRATITAPQPKADSTGKNPILDSAGKVRLFEETVQFDTQGNVNIPGSELYRAMIGRETLITMDGEGRVQDVSNVDPIMNAYLKLRKVNADTVHPQTLEGARQGIRFEIGTQMSLLFFQLIPDSAVSVGASWSRSDSLPVAGLAARAIYTSNLASIREADGERLAQVKTTLQTRIELPKKNMENEYLSMKIESVAVSGESEYLMSVVSGFPVSKKSTMSVSRAGTGTTKQGPDKGKSQHVTYKESTITSIRRTGFKPGA